MKYVRWLTLLMIFPLLTAPASAHETGSDDNDARVAWSGAPCTEPVLLIPTDKENVRDHIPHSFPGSEDEFMENVATIPAPGGALATVVITLNRCEPGTITRTHNGNEQENQLSSDTTEVLVMVMYDGGGGEDFEFYTLASWVNEPKLAGAFRWLGLPAQHTPNLVYDLDASPTDPRPGEEVSFTVAIPHTFRVDGTVERPQPEGEGGHALQYYHGNRGVVTVDHDTPLGGFTQTVNARVTVTGHKGEWLADLLGSGVVNDVTGMYLEKLEGHAHTATLE